MSSCSDKVKEVLLLMLRALGWVIMLPVLVWLGIAVYSVFFMGEYEWLTLVYISFFSSVVHWACYLVFGFPVTMLVYRCVWFCRLDCGVHVFLGFALVLIGFCLYDYEWLVRLGWYTVVPCLYGAWTAYCLSKEWSRGNLLCADEKTPV